MKRALLLAVLCVPLAGCSLAGWLLEDEVRREPAAPYLQPDGTFVFTETVKAQLEAKYLGTEVLSAHYDPETGTLVVLTESPAEEAAETAIEELLKGPIGGAAGLGALIGILRVFHKRQKSKKAPAATEPAPVPAGPARAVKKKAP